MFKLVSKATGHGGKRDRAGRPTWALNKATREQGASLSELAKSYTDIAFTRARAYRSIRDVLP